MENANDIGSSPEWESKGIPHPMPLIITSWWLNQPIWKTLVKLDRFPQIGVKKTYGWNHHLALMGN